MSEISAPAAKIGRTTLIQTALNTIAMVAFALLALTSFSAAGFILAAVTMAALAVRFTVRGPGGYATVQLLVLLSFLVYYDRRPGISPLDDRLLIATGIVLMGMLLNQTMFKRIVIRTKILLANLPGASFPTDPLVKPQILFIADFILVALVGVSAAVNAPGWPVAALTGIVAILHLALVIQAALRRRHEHNSANVIRTAVERHAPKFILFFSAPANSEFHVAMWYPYLRKLNRNFIIMVRERHHVEVLAEMSDQPVIFCSRIADVDNLVVPSVNTAYYVNNAGKNTHLVRFGHVRHIFLNHGDSDKSSSWNPIVAMFDKLYVAGEGGRDRYLDKGVMLEPERFEIVGRPQVAGVQIARHHVSEVKSKTVLYAPTWTGYFSDTSHSSLRLGTKIVGELLKRDVRVIYRPHPYTDRYPNTRAWGADINAMLAADKEATGRDHLFGDLSKVEMSLYECFDASDAAIADVSGVSSDFLYSEKPLAITDAQNEGDAFIDNNPIAKGTYVIDHEGTNVAEVIDNLIGSDPMDKIRREVKRYTLGDFPAETYADVFATIALHDIDTPKVVGAADEVRAAEAAFVMEQRRPIYDVVGDDVVSDDALDPTEEADGEVEEADVESDDGEMAVHQ